jgi:Fe-S cluster assembly protein SufD
VSVETFVEQFGAGAAGGETEPAWLGPLRRDAIERFKAVGFPTTRDEDWHFTSVSPIAEAEFLPLPDGGGEAGGIDIEPFAFGAADWTQLVFVNGRAAPELSSLGRLPPRARV